MANQLPGFPGILLQVESRNKNLRTMTVEGVAQSLPEVNRPFIMRAPPIDPSATLRVVETTPVQRWSRVGDDIEFETRNSTYRFSRREIAT